MSETARAELLSLQSAIEIAQAQSPELRAGEQQYDSARAKRRLALMPSEPTFSLAYNDMTSPFSRASAASRVYQITQPIGFPGRAILNSSALGDQSEVIRFQMNSTKRQVAVNVKQAYYGLALARKNIALNANLKESYQRILAIAKRRYENGAITQIDYLNAQIALTQNENDLMDLLSAEKLARTQLNVLLKREPSAEVEVSPVQMVYHPPIKMETAAPKMLESRAEVQSAKAQLSASEKTHKLAWMSVLPDFQLVAGETFYDVHSASPYSSTPNATAAGVWPTRTYMVGMQFTVPIWSLFNEREVIVGASHDRAAAEANLDMVSNQSLVLLETTVETINALGAKIENYEKHLIPLSDQSFDLAVVNYSSGKVDFQTLSDTASTRRGLKLAYTTAVVNYLTNYATYGLLIDEDL